MTNRKKGGYDILRRIMSGNKIESSPHILAETVEVLISELIEMGKGKNWTISDGVMALYETHCRSGETLPVYPLPSLDALRQFLDGRCPSNPDNYYSTDQALFIIVHPPSGESTSNGRTFVSLCHHGFTVYSDLRGPVLTAPTPSGTLKVRRGKRAAVFSICDQLENNPYIFLDRSGLNDKASLPDDRGERGSFKQGFIEGIAEENTRRPKISNERITRVYVPLSKDGKTFAEGWSIYAVTNSPQESNAPIIKRLSDPIPEGEKPIPASYIDLRTGNSLIDDERLTRVAWTITILVTVAIFTAYGIERASDTEAIWEKVKEIFPYVIGGLCCGFIAFPTAMFLWALNEDNQWKR